MLRAALGVSTIPSTEAAALERMEAEVRLTAVMCTTLGMITRSVA